MLGKPIELSEARDLYHSGLKIVSCYQYGKEDTADWLGGQAAGIAHAKRGWQCHVAAGGSYGAPISASIDDNPSSDQYKQQVAPYFGAGKRSSGSSVSGSTETPRPSTWPCRTASVPTTGSTTGDRHQASPTRPQRYIRWRSNKRSVGGGGVDLNTIRKPNFGQWD
jgi:Domain of unknown function (DUF1906)